MTEIKITMSALCSWCGDTLDIDLGKSLPNIVYIYPCVRCIARFNKNIAIISKEKDADC